LLLFFQEKKGLIPMSDQFDRLVSIMAQLRGPGGCPWDAEQTHDTLRKYLVEETYEVLEAIDSGDPEKLREELGDLLLQVVFHAQLGSDAGTFTIDEVCNSISDKLVRRHPHVFADATVTTTDTVVTQWEQIKKEESAHKERTSILDGVPKGMPALLRALKYQKKASRVGFEWENVDGAFDKVDEEYAEFRAAVASGDPAATEDELGDLFFTLVNVARYVEIDPETALDKTIQKFIRRFSHVEKSIAAAGGSLADATLEQMDALWDQAKELEKNGRP
jgi:tetrapyrrole methylase family protein/MazG family protein